MTNIHCIGQHFNSFVEKNLSCFYVTKFYNISFILMHFLKKIHVCPIYITLLVVSVHKKYQFGNCWHSVYATNAYFVSFNHELLIMYFKYTFFVDVSLVLLIYTDINFRKVLSSLHVIWFRKGCYFILFFWEIFSRLFFFVKQI